MGTRHLTAVILDGAHRVAQYGQWDGYPQGAGAKVLNFLATWDEAKFRQQVAALPPFYKSERAVDALWKKHGGQMIREFMPQLHRDTGASILHIVHHHPRPKTLKLEDQFDFAKNSLFCEWAYVIDLDKRTFEVYEGYNKKGVPEGERFAGIDADKDGYYPVRLVRTYHLDALPTVQDLVAQCDPQPADEAVEA